MEERAGLDTSPRVVVVMVVPGFRFSSVNVVN